MRVLEKDIVYLYGNGAMMHDRIARRAGSYAELEQALRGGRRFAVGVTRENCFALGPIASYAAVMAGCRANVPPLDPSPVTTLPKRFQMHLETLGRALDKIGVGVELLDAELPAILDHAASLVPRMTEAEVLRLLGVVTRQSLVGPHWFVFEVENRCNEDCIYCNIHAKGRRPGAEFLKGRLPFDVYKRQVDDLARMGTDGVTILANGEPTVHPNFIEMIEYAKAKGLRVNFFTNGLLLKPDIARRVVDAGCDEMFCTVSGATADVFLKLHPKQKPAEYDLLMNNLRYLHEYRRERGSTFPRTLAVHVMTRANAHELVPMAEQAAWLGFDSLRPQLIRVDEHNFPMALRPDDRERMMRDLPRCKEICAENGIELWPPFEAMVATAEETPDNWTPDEFLEDGCPIGWALGLAKANGDLSLCCVVKPLGNLSEGSIGELWHGEEYQRYRLAALELDQNKDLPMRDGRPLFTYRCLRCDNHDINRRTFAALRDSGMIRFYRGAPAWPVAAAGGA
ncbi:MAG: radical SAM protein [Deltaproteobacteria bacterium]|nr:radical SAM protein [Deltaproteobacteria bacterium]